MRRPLNLNFPRQRGWPRVALVVSILLHILLFLGPVESRPPALVTRIPRLIAVPPSVPDKGAPDAMVFVMPGERTTARRQAAPEIAGRGMTRPPAPVVVGPTVSIPVEPPPQSDTGHVQMAPERRGFASVGPAYGEGLLWVRPVPVSPADLAKHLQRSHVELVDSAVTVIMQAFLDSLDAERGAALAKLPDWTTTVSGRKFGVDSRYIYLAGLKIPAAVLALLPLPQGNIDQARAYNHLMDLRADIEQAARRAENMDEFKRAIREIRERKQRDRDFERAQRETPPPPPPENAPTP
ncbi:MAG: hypothetical protein ABI613_06655 [Gemmatimonadota bacterium]